MTKEQAAALFAKVTAAMIAEDFHGGPSVALVVPEYRHGWIIDPNGGPSWNRSMALDEPTHCPVQAAWAYL